MKPFDLELAKNSNGYKCRPRTLQRNDQNYCQTPPDLNYSRSSETLTSTQKELKRIKMSLMPWVKIEKWCNETGDTMDAVHSRRKAGKWLDGQQCKVVDGRLWINVKSAIEWIEQWPKNNLTEVEK